MQTMSQPAGGSRCDAGECVRCCCEVHAIHYTGMRRSSELHLKSPVWRIRPQGPSIRNMTAPCAIRHAQCHCHSWHVPNISICRMRRQHAENLAGRYELKKHRRKGQCLVASLHWHHHLRSLHQAVARVQRRDAVESSAAAGNLLRDTITMAIRTRQWQASRGVTLTSTAPPPPGANRSTVVSPTGSGTTGAASPGHLS